MINQGLFVCFFSFMLVYIEYWEWHSIYVDPINIVTEELEMISLTAILKCTV